MFDPTIIQQYVTSLANEYQALNNNAMQLYRDAFANWMIQQIGTPPSPPQLVMFSQPLALQIVENWSNAMTNAMPVLGTPSPVCDLSPAISYVTAAPIAVLPPVVAPLPSDPVGPATGGVDQFGFPTYLNVVGETPTEFPNGYRFTDARGTFLHEVSATPFGLSGEWALLPPAPAPSPSPAPAPTVAAGA